MFIVECYRIYCIRGMFILVLGNLNILTPNFGSTTRTPKKNAGNIIWKSKLTYKFFNCIWISMMLQSHTIIQTLTNIFTNETEPHGPHFQCVVPTSFVSMCKFISDTNKKKKKSIPSIVERGLSMRNIYDVLLFFFSKVLSAFTTSTSHGTLVVRTEMEKSRLKW